MHGAGPLTVGYLIALESIAWSTVAVMISGRTDGGRMNRVGGVMVTLGVIGFATIVPFAPMWWAVPPLLLAGAGFGIAYTFILARISETVAPADKERAAAALPTMQLIGYTVGAAGLGLVANAAGIEQATPEAAATAASIEVVKAAALKFEQNATLIRSNPMLQDQLHDAVGAIQRNRD